MRPCCRRPRGVSRARTCALRAIAAVLPPLIAAPPNLVGRRSCTLCCFRRGRCCRAWWSLLPCILACRPFTSWSIADEGATTEVGADALSFAALAALAVIVRRSLLPRPICGGLHLVRSIAALVGSPPFGVDRVPRCTLTLASTLCSHLQAPFSPPRRRSGVGLRRSRRRRHGKGR